MIWCMYSNKACLPPLLTRCSSGLTCTPITAIGVGSGAQCSAQSVCCSKSYQVRASYACVYSHFSLWPRMASSTSTARPSRSSNWQFDEEIWRNCFLWLGSHCRLRRDSVTYVSFSYKASVAVRPTEAVNDHRVLQHKGGHQSEPRGMSQRWSQFNISRAWARQ